MRPGLAAEAKARRATLVKRTTAIQPEGWPQPRPLPLRRRPPAWRAPAAQPLQRQREEVHATISSEEGRSPQKELAPITGEEVHATIPKARAGALRDRLHPTLGLFPTGEASGGADRAAGGEVPFPIHCSPGMLDSTRGRWPNTNEASYCLAAGRIRVQRPRMSHHVEGRAIGPYPPRGRAIRH